MNRSQIEDLFLFLAASYPQTKVAAATLDAYETGLCDLDASDVIRAARHHQRTSNWFPRVAELRKLAAPPPAGLDAGDAWKVVKAALDQTVQGQRGPQIEDPLIAKALGRIGSLQSMLSLSTEDMNWRRKEFLETYEKLAAAKQVAGELEDVGALPMPDSIKALVEGLGR